LTIGNGFHAAEPDCSEALADTTKGLPPSGGNAAATSAKQNAAITTATTPKTTSPSFFVFMLMYLQIVHAGLAFVDDHCRFIWSWREFNLAQLRYA
jgi:hypothetical protein